jgi:hypothetical protein
MTPPSRKGVKAMARHVDLLVNDWVARVQRREAWFSLNGSEEGVQVAGPEAEKWKGLVRPIREPRTGRDLNPETAPKDWLKAFARSNPATYVTLVGPHDQDACPIDGVEFIRMVPSASPRARR